MLRAIFIACVVIIGLLIVQIMLTTYRSQFNLNFNDFQHRNITSILLDSDETKAEEKTTELQSLKEFSAADHQKLKTELLKELRNHDNVINRTATASCPC